MNIRNKAKTIQKHVRRVQPVIRNREKIGKVVYSIMYVLANWKK